MRRFIKGQSTLEYVIILAAVVGAIIAVAAIVSRNLSESGGVYDKITTKMNAKADDVKF